MTPPATAPVRPAPAGPAPALRAGPQSTPRPRRAPAIAPRIPRRVSGPDRLRRATAPALALSELPLLDRLIKGRAWIGLVAFALIGIVTMQLALLKLNAGIGRALVHAAALERENSALSVEASEVESADTVEQQAVQLGMQFVAPGTLRFLAAQGGESEVARAAAALNADAVRAAEGGTSGASAGGASEGSEGAATEGSGASSDEGSPGATSDGSAAAAGEATEAGSASGETTAAAGAAASASEGETGAGEAAEASGSAAGSAAAAGAGESAESSSASSGAASGASASPRG